MDSLDAKRQKGVNIHSTLVVLLSLVSRMLTKMAVETAVSYTQDFNITIDFV